MTATVAPDYAESIVYFCCFPESGGYGWIARTPQGEQGGWQPELDWAWADMRGALDELDADAYIVQGRR